MNETWIAAVTAAARWNVRENAARRHRVVARRRPDGSIFYTARPAADEPAAAVSTGPTECVGYALGTRNSIEGWDYQREH